MKTSLRSTLAAGVAALAFAAASCGSSGGGCVTGQMISCTCNSGAPGAQTCAGGAYTECNCSGGGGGGSANGGGAGNGGGPPDGAKRVFITGATYSGNLGGISGADALCNTAAQGALLDGTYVAWLSGAMNAIDRINDVGPWYTLAATGNPSTIAFNNKANLTTEPLTAIVVNEQGKVIPSGGDNVWTGTLTGGHGAAYTCEGWTVSQSFAGGWYGSFGQTGTWTASATNGTQGAACNDTLHLYCFEQ